jgi:hypothetical protein
VYVGTSQEEILARLRAKAQARQTEMRTQFVHPDLPRVTPTPAPQERLVAPTVLPPKPPAAPARYVPPPAPQAPEGPNPIHTYVSDFSDYVRKTNSSEISVLAAQEDAGQASTPPPRAPRSRLTLVYAIGGVVLLLGAIGSITTLSSFMQSHPQSVAPTQTISTPIFVDDRAQLSGTGSTLVTAIAGAISTPLPLNNVRALYTQNGTTTTTNLFVNLGIPAPSILLRNINNTGSMTGILTTENGESPFFILSVMSYSDTFGGMLSWEPRMLTDLGTLFPAYPSVVPTQTASSTTATSTSTIPSPSKTKTAGTLAQVLPNVPVGFRDVVIANHDARAYVDAQNRYVLVYGYWSPSTLVIVRDPDAFTTILNRLAGSQTAQ